MLTDEADIQTPASFTSSADRQIHTNPVTETLLLDEEAVITDSWEVPTPLNDLSIQETGTNSPAFILIKLLLELFFRLTDFFLVRNLLLSGLTRTVNLLSHLLECAT